MGAVAACLPCVTGPAAAPRARRFESIAKEVTFEVYAWQAPQWQCNFCRAVWAIGWDYRSNSSSSRDVWLQVATHDGGQVEWFVGGGPGACLECDVPWVRSDLR